jgi:hypothetical protein
VTWWMKLKALPAVWRNMETLLAGKALLDIASVQIQANTRVMRQGVETLKAQQAEIRHMIGMAENDAMMLLAYARWCEKHECQPTEQDLRDMVGK